MITMNYNNLEPEEEEEDDDEEDDEKVKARPRARPRRIYEKPLKINEHLVLGSPQGNISIEKLGTLKPACKDLHVLLNDYFREVEITTADGQEINITPKDKVSFGLIAPKDLSYSASIRLSSIDFSKLTINPKKRGNKLQITFGAIHCSMVSQEMTMSYWIWRMVKFLPSSSSCFPSC